MAIHIKAYALAGTYQTYCGSDGTLNLGRAEAASNAHEPILHRRVTHLPAKFGSDQIALGRAVAGSIQPPHHESCVLYIRISQDGWPEDAYSGICFSYEPPATAVPFVAVRGHR